MHIYRHIHTVVAFALCPRVMLNAEDLTPWTVYAADWIQHSVSVLSCIRILDFEVTYAHIAFFNNKLLSNVIQTIIMGAPV